MNDEYTTRDREEQIDLYLSGKLTDREKQQFEEAMNQDASLREEVDLMRYIVAGIQNKQESAVLEELQAISSEEEMKAILQVTEQHILTSLKPAISALHPIEENDNWERKEVPLDVTPGRVASSGAERAWWFAIPVAVVMLGLVFIGYQPRYTTSELYDLYRTPFAYEYFPTRGDKSLDMEQQQTLDRAVKFYEADLYPEALVEFEKVIAGVPADEISEDVLFYSSICLIETHRPEIAISRLQKLADCEECEFEEDAQWQMAVAYLAMGQKEDAKHLLLAMSIQSENRYKAQAAELLHKLGQRKWF